MELNAEQQNNYFSFGNYSMNKIGTNFNFGISGENQAKGDLVIIQENSKSSEISSQKMSIDGREEEIPEKKVKKKRISDFHQLVKKNEDSH